MMNALEKLKYPLVQPIFKSLEAFQPMCTAVLEGIWPGNIWVDDPEQPQSAMLVSFLSGGGAAWCFLAGEPDNASFNTALNKALFEDKVAGGNVGAFLLTSSSEGWEKNLEVIGDPRQPAPMSRLHYVCHNLTYDWKQHLPDGCAIQRMEPALLTQSKLDLPESVRTTLECWCSIDDDRFQDYGFVVVYKSQVVSWATVDFVTAGAGDVGFETLSAFRRRGLGSVAAAAALEHGLKHGIEVHWTCAKDNLGSLRTAQKLSLTLEREYSMYLFMFDLTTHLTQLAYSYLAKGEHQKAIAVYEQLFAREDSLPAWAYFDAAQAWAAVGDSENALKYLSFAVQKGWAEIAVTEQTPEFQILYNTQEWTELLEQMKQSENSP
jgi:RimJ/RimL family protein N-acetyltransferase